MDEHYAEALRRIEKARESGATELDLSKLDLTELPSELWDLSQLTELDLSNNQLSSIPAEVGQLSQLKELNLRSNQLSSIPVEVGQLNQLTSLDLSRNHFSDIPMQITQLGQLTWLSFEYNDLSKLPIGIFQLKQLTWLDLEDNKLSYLPPEINQLNLLTNLYLSNNRLLGLPSQVGQVTHLHTLYLYNNQLSEIPVELGNLQYLRKLSLHTNLLSNLPKELGNLGNLAELNLNGNMYMKSPPREIVQLGTQAVLDYLRELQAGSEQQWVSKLVVVGEGGVGKTSLLRQLRREGYQAHEDSTHGVEIRSLAVPHPEQHLMMQLNAWDFGGQDIYHATHQFFLSNRSLFLLAWNARLGFDQGRVYYWLDTIKALAPESPILLVATHIDERSADFPKAELQREYPQIRAYLEISSKTGQGIDDLRAAIQQHSANLPLMGGEWPATWLRAAEAIRANPEKYISIQTLHRMMSSAGVKDYSLSILTKWLHELGDILYFPDDPELNDIAVLKPQWVSQYISRVLTSEDVARKVGIFTRQTMDEVWADADPTLRERFLRLMEKFDLSYRIPDDPENKSLVVERLTYDEVNYQDSWDAIQSKEACTEITMKFRLGATMPAGIPTWFIARTHRFTTNTHWRFGALFADSPKRTHLGLVRAYPHDRYIEISVRGPYPQNFFALLRDGFELTLARFPGLEFRRKIPCPGHDGEPCTYEFDNQNLERALEKGIREVQCQVSFEMIPVMNLLLGLDNPETRDVILQEIQTLKSENAAHQQQTLSYLAMIQRHTSALFKAEQSVEDSHCPQVFTLTPNTMPLWKEFLGQEMALQLYCNEPGCWHPVSMQSAFDKRYGRYLIAKPEKWLMTMGDYLMWLANALKLVIPVAGAFIDVVDKEHYLQAVSKQLEMTTQLTDHLWEMGETKSPKGAEHLETRRGKKQMQIFPEKAEGASLRQVRNLLDELDPQHVWGGLQKVLTPEGHYLWLCPHHAQQYLR